MAMVLNRNFSKVRQIKKINNDFNVNIIGFVKLFYQLLF